MKNTAKIWQMQVPVLQLHFCPSIGYAASAALAKESLKTNVPVRTLAVTKGYVTEAEADKLLDPYTMTGKRLEKSSCYNYKKAATLGI